MAQFSYCYVMMCRYRLIRYIDDPIRGEGVNIAIVAFDEQGEITMRFLGDKRPESIRHERLERLARMRSSIENSWVFMEWVHWLETFAELHDPVAMRLGLDRLEDRNSNFTATVEEQIELRESDLKRVRPVDYLHDQLIGDPFQNRLEALLMQTELEWTSALTFDAVLELPFAQPIHLDFVVESEEGGHPVLSAFKGVQLLGVSEVASIHALNDACYSLKLALDADVLNVNRTAVLTDDPQTQAFGCLPNGVEVIGIWDDDAASRILRVVGLN
ncbi:MAG: hypothetical protein N0C84_07830 [Candidatus Thiodiazotropha taylori]|uniref:Uncharacterized protein n=1 Tax=Candidatus Thiodiazotropha taylori TaxID=2792791 RepID=A0A9E4N4S0_9GAMM|nr:hypothetical protein [Candidatus Thiodiazotropha taylori]MCW4256361.1 hypothetical protein [Candidatus Thiodiazotropha taylori]